MLVKVSKIFEKDPKSFAQLVAERDEDLDYLEETIKSTLEKAARLFRSRSTTQGKIPRRLTKKELLCGKNRSAKGRYFAQGF